MDRETHLERGVIDDILTTVRIPSLPPPKRPRRRSPHSPRPPWGDPRVGTESTCKQAGHGNNLSHRSPTVMRSPPASREPIGVCISRRSLHNTTRRYGWYSFRIFLVHDTDGQPWHPAPRRGATASTGPASTPRRAAPRARRASAPRGTCLEERRRRLHSFLRERRRHRRQRRRQPHPHASHHGEHPTQRHTEREDMMSRESVPKRLHRVSHPQPARRGISSQPPDLLLLMQVRREEDGGGGESHQRRDAHHPGLRQRGGAAGRPLHTDPPGTPERAPGKTLPWRADQTPRNITARRDPCTRVGTGVPGTRVPGRWRPRASRPRWR